MDVHLTRAGVDPDELTSPDFPAGWRTPRDLVEVFLLAGALEVQARRAVDPRDPFADWVLDRIADEFRFDTLGSLVCHGEHPDLLWRGGPLGRVPLLCLVWQFIDEVTEQHHDLSSKDTHSYLELLSRLRGVELGRNGTALFTAATERMWMHGDGAALSLVENSFLNGVQLVSNGALIGPTPSLYPESLWSTVFRLIERRSPEFYIDRYRARLADVSDILTRGAQRAQRGHHNIFPGWAPQFRYVRA